MRSNTDQPQSQWRQLLYTKRWQLVAPGLLVWWLVGQFDKVNVSFVIADPNFLQQLKLQGRYAELGGLMSMFLLGYGGSLFFWGFLVDRFGPRRCLIVGTLGWAATMIVMSRSTTLKELLIARLVLGATEGNLWPVSNALTNYWFPVREHARAQSFWLSGASLGTMLGVPIATGLIAAGSWRSMMVHLAILALIPLVIFSFISNRPPNSQRLEHASKAVQKDQQMSFGDLLKSTSFWLITICMVISATTIFTMVQWMPSFVTAERHLSREDMTVWLTTGYALAVVVTLLIGCIGDWTMRRALTGAGTCFAFTVLVLPVALFSPPSSSAVLLGALTSAGVVTAALNGALLHTLVQPQAVARGTGIYSGIGTMVPALIGPYGFGKLIYFFGGRYWGGFAFLAALNLIGAICYFSLHRLNFRTSIVAKASSPIQTNAVVVPEIGNTV